MIYFDNNATTMMTADVKKSMLEWCNRGNPSSGYASAVAARKMMADFRTYIGKICGVGSTKYAVIFTSGATESNCTILSSITAAYRETTGRIPHVVMSAIEHKSLMDQMDSYSTRGIATATYVKPTTSGHILPTDVAKSLQPNTCLVCVMHANNETGAINDIAKIGSIAHQANVPFHCDTVQTFGKVPINISRANVDSFSISFHKIHGPPGAGALIIRQQLITGYKLQPLLFGSQNGGMRGGTENLPGIGASFTAVKYTMENFPSKIFQMKKVKKYIIDEIARRAPTRQYTQYIADNSSTQPSLEIVLLSGVTEYYLPNTILLSVVKRGKKKICNGELKKDLESKGIIVSVGSACNTANEKASHVLFAMGADELIRKGALRISICDDSTLEDAKKFVREFLMIVKNHMKH